MLADDPAVLADQDAVSAEAGAGLPIAPWSGVLRKRGAAFPQFRIRPPSLATKSLWVWAARGWRLGSIIREGTRPPKI
jgi:hypothetical protein